MIKLAFFDLDDTLAPVGKPVPHRCVQRLRRIRAKGVRIAVCSGKPVAYLNGFARQIGIPDMILCGENGLAYQIGVGLPPAQSGVLFKDDGALSRITALSTAFKKEFGDKCWYQPNEYAFTPFPRDLKLFAPMREFISFFPTEGLVIYEHPDCFDILPAGADKGSALYAVCGMLGIDPADTVAVGDHVNDHPMFAAAGNSIGIRLKDKTRAARSVRSLPRALDIILKEIKNG